MKLSIIVPVYNSANILRELHNKIFQATEKLNLANDLLIYSI